MHSAMGFFGIPMWGVALVAAALAPFLARAWGQLVEQRVRERSVRMLATLSSDALATGDASRGAGGSNASQVRPSKPSERSPRGSSS
jgi:hypothetical protein